MDPPPPVEGRGARSDAGALVGRRVGLAALQAQGLVLEVRRLLLGDVYQSAGHRHPWEETGSQRPALGTGHQTESSNDTEPLEKQGIYLLDLIHLFNVGHKAVKRIQTKTEPKKTELK